MTTRIASGERTHQVQAQQFTESTNSHGELTRTYFTKRTVWGRVKQLNGKEGEQARQNVPSATHEVVVPYLSWLPEEMQFVVRGRTLGIEAIDNRDFADVELVCLCKEKK